jgi:hypothetical protein
LQSLRTAGEIEASAPSSSSLWALVESEIESASESTSLMIKHKAATEEISPQFSGIEITLEKVARIAAGICTDQN